MIYHSSPNEPNSITDAIYLELLVAKLFRTSNTLNKN